MLKPALLVGLLLPLGAVKDNDRAEQLRKEIAALREQIAMKESELAKLDPKAVNVLSIRWLQPHSMKPGQVGSFGGLHTSYVRNKKGKDVPITSAVPAILRVEKVLGKNSVIVSVGSPGQKYSERPRILITNFDATAIAEGKDIADGKPILFFKAIGTKKVGDKTYPHVEPSGPGADGAKK